MNKYLMRLSAIPVLFLYTNTGMAQSNIRTVDTYVNTQQPSPSSTTLTTIPNGVSPSQYFNLDAPAWYNVPDRPPTTMPPGTYYDTNNKLYITTPTMDPHYTDPARVNGPDVYNQRSVRRSFYPLDPNGPDKPPDAKYNNLWNEDNTTLLENRLSGVKTIGNFFSRGPQFFQVNAPPPK